MLQDSDQTFSHGHFVLKKEVEDFLVRLNYFVIVCGEPSSFCRSPDWLPCKVNCDFSGLRGRLSALLQDLPEELVASDRVLFLVFE